jgi:DNA-binding FadR family transcriptional regulator
MTDSDLKLAISGTLRTPKRLSDDLYSALVRMIDLEFAPGAKLPPETAMAARFGISRPTVRETLAKMREEGLIVSRRGSGSYVAENAKASPTNILPAFSAIDSFQQIKHAYEFRKAVEGEAAFIAAASRSAADLQAVGVAFARLEESVEHRESGPDVDFAFHLAIARASGNAWFADALLAMKGQIQTVIDIARQLSLGKSESHLRAVQSEHVAIYEAIRRQSPEAARDAMRNHLSNTCNRIFNGQSG